MAFAAAGSSGKICALGETYAYFVNTKGLSGEANED